MNVLITGATSGIGQACALKFAQNGHRLILTGRRADRLQALATSLPTAVHTLCFDVGDVAQVNTHLDSIPAAFRPLDVVINNAGKALGLAPFQESEWADWAEMVQVNVLGMLAVAQWAAKQMCAQRSGHIINIGSIAGREAYPKGHVYCGTKHAVDAITQGMRMDLVPYGVKVSQLAPGLVNTEFSQVRFHGDKQRAEQVYAGMQPLMANDVADVAYWMATAPAHVNVADVLLLPTAQAASTVVHRNA